jgi:S-adenosylmethionine:tRNA ribosyltransferase-isomerase
MAPHEYTLTDFDYALPDALIAQLPAAERRASRLLQVRGSELADLRFADFAALLSAGDLVVFNDTRVQKSRLAARKPTGGRIELLLERVLGAGEGLFQLRGSHPPRPGQALLLPAGVVATVLARAERFFHLRLEGVASLADYLDQHAAVPLPPYIARPPSPDDEDRYQTVYARHPGAVAAPTAGLHFDEAMLGALTAAGVGQAWVTLHVGAGTFLPVNVDDITAHRMHAERYRVPAATVDAVAAARARGARIVAVGTTSLRALESAASATGELAAVEGETSLFVTPGFRFRVVDCLLTNFHLPRSTLLMLVCAFGGFAELHAAYRHAVAAGYRFFSYGDAMFIERPRDR